MPTENVNVSIEDRGSARRVARDIDSIGSSSDKAQRGIGLLNSALGGVAAAFGFNELTKSLDAYTNISNSLKGVTKDTDSLKLAMGETFDIAQRTRQPWAEIAGIYGKVSTALVGVGQSAEQAGPLTETIAQAVALSGTSASASAGALTQFQQALSGGKLRGEEFNSVVEGAPRLLDALGEGLGKSRGELKAMADAGQLTNELLIKGLATAAPKVAAAFANMTPTISQAFTVLNNSWLQFIGVTGQATGASAGFANVILLVANNMHILAPILLAVGGALLALGIVAIVGQLYTLAAATVLVTAKFALMTIAFLASPIGFVVAGVTTAIAVFIAFRKRIDQVVEGNGFFATILKTVLSWLDKVVAAVKSFLQTLGLLSKEQGNAASNANKLNDSFGKQTGSANGAATANDRLSSAMTMTSDAGSKLGSSLRGVNDNLSSMAMLADEAAGSMKALSASGPGNGIDWNSPDWIDQGGGKWKMKSQDAGGNWSYIDAQEPWLNPMWQKAGLNKQIGGQGSFEGFGAQGTISQYPIGGGVWKTNPSEKFMIEYMKKVEAGWKPGGSVDTSLMGLKTGGNFMVGGHGGTDSNIVQFRATRGERVTVDPPHVAAREQRIAAQEVISVGKIEIHLHGVTDANSFRRSQTQLETGIQTALERVKGRM